MYRDTVEEIIEGTKYCLTDHIGEGGFSKVYGVLDQHIGKEYALKVVDTPKEDAGREIELLKSLKHDGLPGLHDVFAYKKYTCIVMEYIKGESLEQYVAKKGKLLPKEALILGKQVCELLCYLHSRSVPVIHGDLKPSNIMVCDGKIRLIDFGGAFLQYDKKKQIYGTKGYASPEQYRNELFTQSDVYAFGMVMLYMLTGRQAHLFANAVTAAELKRYGIPCRLRKLILQCLSFNINQRFASGRELSEAIQKVKGVARKLPGQCITCIGMVLRLLGSGSILYVFWAWKQQGAGDMKQWLAISAGLILLSGIAESFSHRAYKTAILECECSLFVSEGL